MENFSNIEVFYSNQIQGDKIILKNDEFHHCVNVFRKRIKDIIYITDGMGNLYSCEIVEIFRSDLVAEIFEKRFFQEQFGNFVICIPLLKNKDRFRFAIEKSVEMGITKFIFFKSERTITNKFDKEKILRIMIESIKQSIRTYIPEIKFYKTFIELIMFARKSGAIFLFDSESKNSFNNKIIFENKKNYFIFGPEGGFTDKELKSVLNIEKFRISDARLRSETAILKVVALIT